MIIILIDSVCTSKLHIFLSFRFLSRIHFAFSRMKTKLINYNQRIVHTNKYGKDTHEGIHITRRIIVAQGSMKSVFMAHGCVT